MGGWNPAGVKRRRRRNDLVSLVYISGGGGGVGVVVVSNLIIDTRISSSSFSRLLLLCSPGSSNSLSYRSIIYCANGFLSLFSLLSAPYLLGERKRERGTHSQWLKPTERKRRWIKAKAEARRNLVAVLRSRGRQRHHTGKREEKNMYILYRSVSPFTFCVDWPVFEKYIEAAGSLYGTIYK